MCFSTCSHWWTEEKYCWNLMNYLGFDYVELALSPKILGDFKPNADCSLWLASVVVFVGQKSWSCALNFWHSRALTWALFWRYPHSRLLAFFNIWLSFWTMNTIWFMSGFETHRFIPAHDMWLWSIQCDEFDPRGLYATVSVHVLNV